VKVLAVLDSLSFGGAENLVTTLAGVGPQVGIEVDVLSLAPPTPERSAWLPALRQAGLEPRFLGLRRLAQPDAVPLLTRAIRAARCDVVHAHLEYSATLAPPAAALAGRRAVCTFHHTPGPLRGREAARERLAVAVANRSQGVIFVSAASRAGFAARYRCRPDRWAVLPNGVDLARYRPPPDGTPVAAPADLAIPAGVPVVTVVAALRPPKGHAVALAAWPAVLAAAPEARLLLVGSGPEESALRAQARSLAIADRVVFAGLRGDVPQLLAASTLALLPTWTEALPTALVEAAACGLPAVASAVGGVPEVVADGSSGLLVPPGDPAALAAAVTAVLRDDGRRTEMGRAARALAERRFDAVRWAGRLRAGYAAAAAGGPAAAAFAGAAE